LLIDACRSPEGRNANYPGCLSALLLALLEKHDFDYILVDMSPSAWVVNKLFVSSCEFLLVPCSCDFFSSMAIRSLGHLLIEWDDWKESIRARYRPESMPSMPLPKSKPIFLGHTFQLFTVYDDKPATQFKSWMDRINELVANVLIPKLRRRGMAAPSADGELACVRNTQSIGAAASKCHVPVFVMTAELAILALGGDKGRNAWSQGQNIVANVRHNISILSGQLSSRWWQVPGHTRDGIVKVQADTQYMQSTGLRGLEFLAAWEGQPDDAFFASLHQVANPAPLPVPQSAVVSMEH
jgi:hypothetical protein